MKKSLSINILISNALTKKREYSSPDLSFTKKFSNNIGLYSTNLYRYRTSISHIHFLTTISTRGFSSSSVYNKIANSSTLQSFNDLAFNTTHADKLISKALVSNSTNLEKLINDQALNGSSSKISKILSEVNNNLVLLKKNRLTIDNKTNKSLDLWDQQKGVFATEKDHLNYLSINHSNISEIKIHDNIFQETTIKNKFKLISDSSDLTNHDHMNYDQLFELLSYYLTQIMSGNFSFIHEYNNILIFLCWLLYMKCGLSKIYITGLVTAKLHILKIIFSYNVYLFICKKLEFYLNKDNNLNKRKPEKKSTNKKGKKSYYVKNVNIVINNNVINNNISPNLTINYISNNYMKYDYYMKLNIYPSSLTVNMADNIPNNFDPYLWENIDSNNNNNNNNNNNTNNNNNNTNNNIEANALSQDNLDNNITNMDQYLDIDLDSIRQPAASLFIASSSNVNAYEDTNSLVNADAQINALRDNYVEIISPFLPDSVGDDVTYQNYRMSPNFFSSEIITSFLSTSNTIVYDKWDKYDTIITEAKEQGVSFDINNCIARSLRYYRDLALFVTIAEKYYSLERPGRIEPNLINSKYAFLKPQDLTRWIAQKKYVDFIDKQSAALRYHYRHNETLPLRFDHIERIRFKATDAAIASLHEMDSVISKHWRIFLIEKGTLDINLHKFNENNAEQELYNAFIKWQYDNLFNLV